MTDKITILIVDDEKDICDQISGLLKDDGFLTFSANNSDDAIKYLKSEKINLVILDIWLNNSKLDGFKTLEKIKKLNELIPIIMISGHGNIETAVSAIKQGAYDFIEKPFDSDILLFKVNKALENIDLKEEIKKLTNDNEQFFVRNSDITKKLYTIISKISKTESTILLSGSSGSGKEVVAKEIHNLSNRKNKPFGILSCANLDPETLEKKLFGTEGKDNLIQVGILEKLNGGTILFDQIEDLPLKSQGKIIRFLEDQKITRIGGNNSILINVRIIAITKVNLVKLIEEKKFREDLYFKLNVMPIIVPSLEKRSEDILDLCNIFANDYIIKNNLKSKFFSIDCIEYFKTVKFPGNVRQLKNLVEWILIMLSDSKRNEIKYNDLPEEIKIYLNNKSLDESNSLSKDFTEHSLKDAKEIFEKKFIEYHLLRFNHNILKVSEFIGMERTALYRKIKNLKINQEKEK